VTDTHLVVGLGVTGRAVAAALGRRRIPVLLADDRPGDAARRFADEQGLELLVAPGDRVLEEAVRSCAAVVPSPGLPDRHPVFGAAAAAGVPVLSEFDLAAAWDDRPLLAVTGTNGKTTVTILVTEILQASGKRAVVAGNTDVPLVAAIDDDTVEVFVVEASSFRLRDTRRFTPAVATWLNLAPDHLDSHGSLDHYIACKARIWADQSADQVAIGNADDPVVLDHLRRAPGRRLTFGLAAGADYRVDDGLLRAPTGEELARVDELPRSLPHDLANALAAVATAIEGGADPAAVRPALLAHQGLPHRMALVGEAGDVRWYDDSKATAPHATLAAVRGLESVVLIAGGRNKGLDLGQLAAEAARIRSVVAIGEAAPEVAAAFDGIVPVTAARSMDEAVEEAASRARAGDAVVLSPACTSYDWYGSYAERGADFVRAVQALLTRAAAPGGAR
jgi:UDP-N-acetylmuramoylalanine--D-glutamate ligase